MSGVFVHWDNSNIYHEAELIAEERDSSPGARYSVRVHFDNMLRLAHADRPLTKALAAGSIPPPMQQFWNWLENGGVEYTCMTGVSATGVSRKLPTNGYSCVCWKTR